MKKILLLISLFLFLISIASTAFAASYPDVPEDHPNYQAIEYLDESQIINGYEDGTFGPDNLVNRAEASKIIIGSLNIPHEESYAEIFPDVKKDQWFFPYIMSAQKNGFVNGYADNTFKPGDTVNLAETLKILVLTSKVKLPEVTADVFIDVPAKEWYAPYMLYARNHNIVLSDDYGYAAPDQAMTRAAFSEIVYRMMIVLRDGEKPFPLHTNWPRYESGAFPFSMKYNPGKWELIENSDEVVFFRPDKEFLQFSPARMYPNSAVIRITLDENAEKMGKAQYFSNLKDAFPGAEFTEFKFFDLSAVEVVIPNERIVDWYIYLINGNVLAAYTQYGTGALGFQLQQIISAMLSTLEYREVQNTGEDYSELLSVIFNAVLVEGVGMQKLDTLPDKLIIETDTIGVGTGPVDYYYSDTIDYTFKYERNGDTILDTREGRTTSF